MLSKMTRAAGARPAGSTNGRRSICVSVTLIIVLFTILSVYYAIIFGPKIMARNVIREVDSIESATRTMKEASEDAPSTFVEASSPTTHDAAASTDAGVDSVEAGKQADDAGESSQQAEGDMVAPPAAANGTPPSPVSVSSSGRGAGKEDGSTEGPAEDSAAAAEDGKAAESAEEDGEKSTKEVKGAGDAEGGASEGAGNSESAEEEEKPRGGEGRAAGGVGGAAADVGAKQGGATPATEPAGEADEGQAATESEGGIALKGERSQDAAEARDVAGPDGPNSDEGNVPSTSGADSSGDQTGGDTSAADAVPPFPVCPVEHMEIIPCLDNRIHKKMKLKLSTQVMEHYERHCPTPELRLKCLVPPPRGYKVPIRWPESRDTTWRANIPHTFLANEKSDQNWMVVEGDKIRFPGGGTHFSFGADKYIAQIARMLGSSSGDISLGGRIRTVFDVGCGVASFGAYMLPAVQTMSLAPNDVHQNQIQFALERGVPAMLGVLGTVRLPYPTKSFELAHCSRCRIDWAQRGGTLLLEVDRLLRPGGYWVWSAPPVYRGHKDPEEALIWEEVTGLTTRMCWKLVAKESQTAIFQKPADRRCYRKRKQRTPLICPGYDREFDNSWNTSMKACIAPFPREREMLVPLPPWPQRVNATLPRLKHLNVSPEAYVADTEAWKGRVAAYWRLLGEKVPEGAFRNVLDMSAQLGGFAAALADKPVWVMNTVPPRGGPNTLTIVYDRGFLGVLHDWCEAFSTYPRTYDLLHAAGVVSRTAARGCAAADLLLEMDRILRPTGFAIFRDTEQALATVRRHLAALRWKEWAAAPPAAAASQDGADMLAVLIVQKPMWAADGAPSAEEGAGGDSAPAKRAAGLGGMMRTRLSKGGSAQGGSSEE